MLMRVFFLVFVLVFGSFPFYAAANVPFSVKDLGGRWQSVIIYNKRSGFDNRIERKRRDYSFTFTDVGTKQLTANKIVEGKNEPEKSVPMKIKEDNGSFTLTLLSNSAKVRKGIPFYYLDPVYSKNGVDILKQWTESVHLVRFKRSEAAEAGGFGKMGFNEFCDGPAVAIAKAGQPEIALAQQQVSRYPQLFKDYDAKLAAILGILFSKTFEEQFGTSISKMSAETIDELLERLKFCAVMHEDREMADAITAAILKNVDHKNIRGLLQLDNTSPKRTSLGLSVSSGRIRGVASIMETAVAKLDQIENEVDEEKKTELIEQVLPKFIGFVPPTRAADVIDRLWNPIATRRTQKKQEDVAAAEAAKPSLTESEAVLTATQQYFLDNCNRVALVMKASDQNNGNAVLSALLARSIQPENGECVINMHTHLMHISVNKISFLSCGGQDQIACEFVLNWSCRLEENESFGFSTRSNFDPICPFVRAAVVPMKGDFKKTGHRKWRASNLKW